MTRECYQIKVFGVDDRYVQDVDVKSVTGTLYDEDTAWEKARAVLRAAEAEGLDPQVFVTKCTAEISEDYDVPVMDPE